MKKPFFYLLTAGLAFSMLSDTNTTNAVEVDSSTSNATISFSEGDLALDEVSDITFGANPIAVDDTDIASETGATLSVTDLRGSGAGWHVTAQLNPFISPESENSLPGASLNLVTGEAESTAGEAYNPSVPAGTSLLAGGASAAVVTAGENTGLGQTVATWAAEATTLTVPGSIATAGEEHLAVINWTLEDTPQ